MSFRSLFARSATLIAVLIVLVKALAVALHPASWSPRLFPNACTVLMVLALLRMGRRLKRQPEDAPTRPIRSALLVAAGAVMLAFIGLIAWVDNGLNRRVHAGVYDDPHKVWGARGLVVEGPDITKNGSQNSIESIGLAFSKGARGTEVDVFFDAETNRFIVSHDRPYNLKNGALLTLRELLTAVGQDGAFWLDWKKLRHLDDAQLDLARAELEELTAVGGLRQRFYIEGEDPLNLHYFKRAGFLTIFDTHPLPDAHFLTPVLVDLYKAAYYLGGYTVMGMNSGTLEEPIYGPETRRAMHNVPQFIYHVPDVEEQLADLLGDPDVRVILVENHSLARYHLRAPATPEGAAVE